jgi:hypothetical protein
MRTALVYFVVLLCVAVLVAASPADAKQMYWNGTDWLLWWIRR